MAIVNLQIISYLLTVIFFAIISAISSTFDVVARAIALLHSGQEVTIVSHPVASSSAVIRVAMVCCCASVITVFANDEPQHSERSLLCFASRRSPTADITLRGAS